MRIAVIAVVTGLILAGCVTNFGCAPFKAHKEVELSSEAGKALEVSTTNGGIEVTAGQGPCKVIAAIDARATSPQAADELLKKVTVRLDKKGDVVKTVIDQPFKKHVAVSFKVTVPAETELKLSTTNGAIKVSSMKGAIVAHTVNGSIRTDDSGGNIKVDSTNGGIDLNCDPNAAISNIYASTVNGSISAAVPKSFAGSVKLSTVNGSIHNESGLTIKGQNGKSVDGTIGAGGGKLELRTVNGSIKLR